MGFKTTGFKTKAEADKALKKHRKEFGVPNLEVIKRGTKKKGHTYSIGGSGYEKR